MFRFIFALLPFQRLFEIDKCKLWNVCFGVFLPRNAHLYAKTTCFG